MKKGLSLTAALLTVFAFATPASAIQVNFEQSANALALQSYEGGGGGGTVVPAAVCTYYSESTCMNNIPLDGCSYSCYKSGSCYYQKKGSCNVVNPNTNLNNNLVLNNNEVVAAQYQLTDDVLASGNDIVVTPTRKVSGSCPAGMTLSDDKCCCVVSN